MIVRWAFLLLLALAPLPLGSNRPLPSIALALAVGGLLLAWALPAAFRPAGTIARPDPIRPAIVGFLLVVSWIFIQVSALTPRAWHHPFWQQASDALNTGVDGRISIDVAASEAALMLLLTYAGGFWLAMQIGRTPAYARRVLQAVALIGFGYAVYGLIVQLLGLDTILWWQKWASHGFLTSTFVNRNSYATYAGLGLVCAIALLIEASYPIIVAIVHREIALRTGLVRLARRSSWLLLFSASLALAAVLTASRAGIASITLGILTLVWCLGRAGGIRARHLGILAVMIAACGAGLFILAGQGLQQRLANADLEDEARFPRYARIVDAIFDAPILGTGYGTFAAAFYPYDVFWYEPRSVAAEPPAEDSTADEESGHARIVGTRWYDAHNTYLEAAFELGIPIALILVGSIGSIVLACARQLRRSPSAVLYVSVGLAATVVVGAHAMLDFSLEIPAVALTYSAILGVAVTRATGRGDLVACLDQPAWRSRHHLAGILLAAVASIGILALAVPRGMAHVTGMPMTVAKRELDIQYTPAPERLDRAIAAGRRAAAWADEAEFLSAVGVAELTQAHREGLLPSARRMRLEQAREALLRSLLLAPANPAAWTQLAYTATLLDGSPSLIGRALRLSVLTGPGHGPLLAFRSALALAHWANLDEGTRALFDRQFALTVRMNPGPFIKAIRSEEEVRLVRTSLRDDELLTQRFDRLVRLLR